MNPSTGSGGRRDLSKSVRVAAALLAIVVGCADGTGSVAPPEPPGLAEEARPASEPPPESPETVGPDLTPPSSVTTSRTDNPAVTDSGCSFLDSMAELESSVFQFILSGPDGTGLGTAFYIGDGDYLTAAHLATGHTTARLRNEGNDFPVTVSAIDPLNDLALLRASGSPSEPLQLRTDVDIRPGEVVAAVGYPLFEEYRASITGGLVSRISEVRGLGLLIQTDAPINRGNSGGPLVDQCGRVVGMAAEKWFEVGVDGMAWAIPASAIEAALAHLRNVPPRVVVRTTEPVPPTQAVAADTPSVHPQGDLAELGTALQDVHDRIEASVRLMESRRSDPATQAQILWRLAEQANAYRLSLASEDGDLGESGGSCALARRTFARALGWTSRLAGYHAAQVWNPAEEYHPEQIEALQKSREITAEATEHRDACAAGR